MDTIKLEQEKLERDPLQLIAWADTTCLVHPSVISRPKDGPVGWHGTTCLVFSSAMPNQNQ